MSLAADGTLLVQIAGSTMLRGRVTRTAPAFHLWSKRVRHFAIEE